MGEMIDFGLVGWGIVNLIILYFVLKHFLYRPVKKYIAERQARYTDERAAIDADKRTVVEEKREYRRIVEGAQKEADQLTYQKLVEAEDRAGRIVEDAKAHAEQTLREAQHAIEEDRKRAQAQMREEVVSMAIGLSGKILEREVKQEDNQRIIDGFFEKVS